MASIAFQEIVVIVEGVQFSHASVEAETFRYEPFEVISEPTRWEVQISVPQHGLGSWSRHAERGTRLSVSILGRLGGYRWVTGKFIVRTITQSVGAGYAVILSAIGTQAGGTSAPDRPERRPVWSHVEKITPYTTKRRTRPSAF